VSDLAGLAGVERHVSASLKAVSDRKGDTLLRREGSGVALLPEASRLLARLIALAVLRDLAAVLGDLRAAYNAQPGESEPDWNRVGNAVAWAAIRRAEQSLNAGFRLYRAERDEGDP
jgi:hypothetical protein